jgi:5-methylcytosine-specific restriction endonuclease McrBC regulatory subunit McrC
MDNGGKKRGDKMITRDKVGHYMLDFKHKAEDARNRYRVTKEKRNYNAMVRYEDLEEICRMVLKQMEEQ